MSNNNVLIVFVPGAFSTEDSFNYIKTHLQDYEHVSFSYNIAKEDYSRIIQRFSSFLTHHRRQGKRVIVIGHSYGGAIAKKVAEYSQNLMDGLITIAAPHKGIFYPWFIRMFHLSQFVANTDSKNDLFDRFPTQLTIPHLNIIANKGFDLFFRPSHETDGVVSVYSQTLDDCSYQITVNSNHHEVLQSDKCVLAIRQFIWYK